MKTITVRLDDVNVQRLEMLCEYYAQFGYPSTSSFIVRLAIASLCKEKIKNEEKEL